MSKLVAAVALAAVASGLVAHGAGTRVTAAPTLVVDNSFALDTTDPQRAFDPTSFIVDRAVYDTLFTYRANDLSHPIPLLVRSWTSKQAKTFTFRLRRDVHFADGTPLTSADVVFSLRRLVNLKGNPSFLLSGIGVSAKDRFTVVMTSSTPTAQLPALLATPATAIVNAKLVRSHGGTDAADASTADRAERWFNSPASHGAGSGPYAIASYAPTSQVALRANARYWGARSPAFAGVVVRNMSAPTQFVNIQRGVHEIAIDLSADQATRLKANAKLRVSLQPSPWVFYAFTNDDPQVSQVTSNPRFQQAVRSALDYEGIRGLAGPGAVQAAGLIPSMLLGALPKRNAIAHDIAKAKTELAASGVADRQVTLEFPSDVTINGVPFATLAQKIQADLRAAGFDVALAGSPVAAFQPKFRAGRIAFGIWLWAPDYPDPADYLVFTPGGLIASHVGWPKGSDAALERLAAKALLSTAPAARGAVYRQIQLGLNARSPFIPLIQPTQAFVATKDIADAAFSGAYDVDVTQVVPR